MVPITIGVPVYNGAGLLEESLACLARQTFGDFKDCSEHLAHAVYGFFNNGGSRCFVVNVGAPEGAAVRERFV